MISSHFDNALSTGEMVEVGMNCVDLTVFGAGTRAIGTQNLNGCTAVAIVSHLAAILAHIPPLPYITTDPNAGMKNLGARMAEVVALYRENITLFPPESSSLVVGALIEEELSLPDHVECVTGVLCREGLPPTTQYYPVRGPEELRLPAHGTLLIDARQGSPTVYLQDQFVAVK